MSETTENVPLALAEQAPEERQESVEQKQEIAQLTMVAATRGVHTAVNRGLVLATGAAVLSIACAAVLLKSVCSWVWGGGKSKTPTTKSATAKQASSATLQQATSTSPDVTRAPAAAAATSGRRSRTSRASPRSSTTSPTGSVTSPGAAAPANTDPAATAAAPVRRVRQVRRHAGSFTAQHGSTPAAGQPAPRAPRSEASPEAASPTQGSDAPVAVLSEPTTAATGAAASTEPAAAPAAVPVSSAPAVPAPTAGPGGVDAPVASQLAVDATPMPTTASTQGQEPAAEQQAAAEDETAAPAVAAPAEASAVEAPASEAPAATPVVGSAPSVGSDAHENAAAAPAAAPAAAAPSARTAALPSRARCSITGSSGTGSRPHSRSVTLDPAAVAAEAARARTSSRSSGGGSSSGSGTRRLTVADVLREAIKEKKRNERLKQQLRAMEGAPNAGTPPRGSSSGSRGADTEPKPASDSPAKPPAAISSSTAGRDQASNAAAAGPAADAATDAARSSDRDTASNQAADSPAKAGAAAAAAAGGAGLKAAAAAAGAQQGASGPVGGRALGGEGGAKRTVADFAREVAALQEENKHLKQLLHTQARDSNAEIMASFFRRGSDDSKALRTVPEEPQGGAGSSKTGSGAGRISGPAAGASAEGQGTPTNGSELGSFKDHLKLPLSGIPGARGPNSTRSYGDSDAASSLRSGPGGKPSSMWSFLRGATGRRAATTINDQASIPDTLNTPRSSIDPIQQEVLLELLDSFHSR